MYVIISWVFLESSQNSTLTLIGMSYESMKNAHLLCFAGCQINLIEANFHLQKVWKFLITIQPKNPIKKDKEIKVSPLMPTRVKSLLL